MLCLLIHVRFVPKADINHHLFNRKSPVNALAWLASSCFGYLISQVALWLVISAARPPTVS